MMFVYIGWEYRMEVTFVEIYNENIRDLLRTSSSSTTSFSTFSEDVKHEIKKDPHTNTVYITDVTQIEVDPNNLEQINRIMVRVWLLILTAIYIYTNMIIEYYMYSKFYSCTSGIYRFIAIIIYLYILPLHHHCAYLCV